MALNDWLTLLAIVVGPIVAVGITLWVEGRRRRRDSRTTVLRQLMATRHLPADPLYSTAVNLVPVEFNDEPEVMAAYKAYLEALRRAVPEDPDELSRSLQFLVSKQTKMIYAIMRSLGLRASEADLPVEAYAARGMTERDALYIQSLHGTVRIANALEAQLQVLQAAAEAQLGDEAKPAAVPSGEHP